MNRKAFLMTMPALAALTSKSSAPAQEQITAAAPAQDLQPIKLPKPQADGGKSVLAALQERRTDRNIRADKLPPQMLSNLLWAAFGVNREKGNLERRAGPPLRPATHRRSTCTSPCPKASTSTNRSPKG